MKKFQREWLLYKRQHQEFYLTIGFLALPLPENKEHSCYGDIREHTISFDLLGISETKQQTGKNFIGNVKIEGYHIHTQRSKSAAGGVAIYVNNKLDHFKRDDLSILHDEFESIWVEIKNKRRKNFLCGCFYCHPNTDVSNFTDYLESTFSKVNQQNYQVFLLGDFNTDLLQYESHSYTSEFLNTMYFQLLFTIYSPTNKSN